MTEVSPSNALTAALVISKTKCDNLQSIKNLNLWGNELEDLKLLRLMPGLEVVSLSVNCIFTLKEFGYCLKLQELYLRKNNIQDIREIRHLVRLPQLKVLWLHDNPCATVVNYRDIVIKSLPHLTKLDNSTITPEERAGAQKVSFSLGDSDEHPVVSHRSVKENDVSFHPPLSQKKLHGNREIKEPITLKPRVSMREETNQPRVESTPEKERNILSAVMSLLKELDENSLEAARGELDRQLMLRRR